MLYRPNFCCNCGEKIERAEWSLVTSRRFCDPCASELNIADWTPKVITLVVLLACFALISSFSRPTTPTSKHDGVKAAVEARRATNVFGDSNSNTTLPPQVQSQPPTIAGNATISNTAPQNDLARTVKSSEAVYFCGALTKKGTACSRRVKKPGERCWQHAGMPPASENGHNFGR